MKTPVAVTLIIMGALIIITPAVSDYLFQLNIVGLLIKTGAANVNLDGKMSDLYRLACWLTGTAMVAVAVRCSLACSSEPARHATVATHVA